MIAELGEPPVGEGKTFPHPAERRVTPSGHPCSGGGGVLGDRSANWFCRQPMTR